MPTLSFFSYLICLAMVYVFRSTYQGWFSYYLFLVMAAAPALVLLLSLPSMLAVKLQIEGRAFAMRKTRGIARLVFHCALPLPVGQVKLLYEVENRFTGSLTKGEAVYRSCREGVTLLPLPTGHCGQVEVRITRFECRDLFSFFSVRRRCPGPVRCTILPKEAAPEHLPDLDAALNRSPRWKPKPGGGYSEEHELRPYRPGDPANSIHWKLSSKTGDLIVREAQELQNQAIYVVLSPEGDIDRSLEVLSWLSRRLSAMELAHTVVSDALYPLSGEGGLGGVLQSILSAPLSSPAAFDASQARCVFAVQDGKVDAS